MTCYSGFGKLTDGRPFWIGDFNGDGKSDVLFYYPGDDNWWLGTFSGNQLNWGLIGNTAAFGHGINDGRPFWIGRFSRSDRDEILFYYPGDDNWWLGTLDNGQLHWSSAGNTSGFGHGINDGRPFWIGDFNGDGKSDVLFYYPGDDNWWLGTFSGNQLNWGLIGNTAAFGHGINDGRPFWIGRFSRSDRDEILFYYPGDDNWWLGTLDNGQLHWSSAGNTSGFGHGINDGRPFWIGDFNGDGKSDVLFYYPGDDNWWLGTFSGNQLNWGLIGNTAAFGHGINDGRPFWIGRFSRSDRDEILFYYPGDDNWWLGTLDNGQLHWSSAGNTSGFGHGINDGRPFWISDFNGDGKSDVLFYYPGDGNWWLAGYDAGQLNWSLSGNTGRPCRESAIVHFKSLLAINNNINRFIDTQFLAMHDLFAEGCIDIYRGTTEDLSNIPALQPLQNLNVGSCPLPPGGTTADQNTLFANRNNVGNDDLVVYIVSMLIGGSGNFVGCSTHPNGQPGAVVVQVNAEWLTAHEIGHVLGLKHVCTLPVINAPDPTRPDACVAGSGQSDNLMFPNIDWTNTPPDLSASQYTTMLNSNLTKPC